MPTLKPPPVGRETRYSEENPFWEASGGTQTVVECSSRWSLPMCTQPVCP